MTTILLDLMQGTFFWKATIETDGLVYTAQTVFPASMAKADVLKAIAEKGPDITIDASLVALTVQRG